MDLVWILTQTLQLAKWIFETTRKIDHCSHMLEIEFHHHVGLTAWQGLGESYKSLTWKQNMSLWLFESGQVFDPLPNVAQVPAGSGYEYDQGS